jgi:aryl-alcohol dehydrogenase-like predicted oxidoreductase
MVEQTEENVEALDTPTFSKEELAGIDRLTA